MNWLTTILSLYLLGLSLWPCADELLSTTEQERNTVLTASNAPGPGTSHREHDQCTPFCTCACCAVTITVVSRFSYALISPAATMVASIAAFAYEPMHQTDPLAAIWQPPKLRV